MKYYVILEIALVNFWSRKLRAILTVLAVTLGISAIIFLVSLGYGLERLVTYQVASFEAFTVIEVPAANLRVQKINDEGVDTIRQQAHVTTVATSINMAGRIRPTDNESTTETIIEAGDLDFATMSGVTVIVGQWYADDGSEIVINQNLAKLMFPNIEDLEQIIGKEIVVSLNVERDMKAADTNEGTLVYDLEPLKVAGIIEEGQTPNAYISEKNAKDVGVINYSTLKLKVDDKKYVPNVRKALDNLGYSTEYVGDTVDQIAQVFIYFRAILASFGLIALIVATLGTFNTLTISLMERIREIGLLKVLGMQKRDIYLLFLSESIFIGFLGGLLGVGLGYGVGVVINNILRIMAIRSGVDEVYLFYTPFYLAFYTGLFSLVIGFITGLYPARRAVKTDALDAIRYE